MGQQSTHSINGLTRDELDCVIGTQSLRDLPHETRLAIIYRFENPATLEEASLMCGVSPARISKAEKRLIEMHKNIMKVYGFKPSVQKD